jgi:hypothetical protein
MIFFKYKPTKSILAFLGRSGSSSFTKAFIGDEAFNTFTPSEGKATPHSMNKVCFKYQLLENLYPDHTIYAVIRHPFERFQSAINHTNKSFEYFLENPFDVHTKNAYELISGLNVVAYRFEDGGVNNCAKAMGLDNFEKINSTDHVITLTDEQKAIISEKYAKDIELWNSIDENGKEVFLEQSAITTP